MKKLFLDIETLPASPDKHRVLQALHQKRIDAGKNPGDFERYLERTSLDGTWGRIACISFGVDDGPAESLCGDEVNILRTFWDVATGIDLFVGFNILDFDLRFIYQRSIIQCVSPSRELSFARYRQAPIYDVMREWQRWDRSYITLDALALALDLPTSKGGEIEGKNVSQAFEDGRIGEICRYCEADVELTRAIYYRMTFHEQLA
jgi:hypothetical protein